MTDRVRHAGGAGVTVAGQLARALLRRMAAKSSSVTHDHLIDEENAVRVDVEATTAVRQAEVTAAKRMIARVTERLPWTAQERNSEACFCSSL